MSSESNLRLKVTGGPGAGEELSVEDELLLGRESSAAGGLAQDIEISRRHARVARTPEGAWMVEDLGSRNGTHLNGHQIEKAEILAAGDAIELGGTRLVVQVSSPVTPPEPQPSPERPATAVTDAPADLPPEPEPQAAAAAAEIPPVSLRVELDLARGEARISLEDGSDSVRLVFDGAWRLQPGD